MEPQKQTEPERVSPPDASAESPAPTPFTDVVPQQQQTTPANSFEPAQPPVAEAPTVAPQSASVVSGGDGADYVQPSAGATAATPTKHKKRWLLIVIVAIIVLMGLAAGFVFGYYIPNRPANVWNAGLVNTGKGYDTLTTYVTQFGKNTKGVDVDGTYKLKGSVVSDGSLSGKIAGEDAQFAGVISVSGLKLNYEVRAIKSTGDMPDYYFKVDGLQGLGDLLGGASNPELTQMLNGFNNQWYMIDHTLFEQLATSGQTSSTPSLSAKNIQGLLTAISEPTKTYLFTDDTSKAVLTQKEFVAAEKRDGRKTYHYVAAVDKANLKLYLKSVCDAVRQDELGKALLSDGLKTSSCDEFAKQADKIDSAQTADVWIDRGTKLVHAVRITDQKQKSDYIELSQDYQSGTSFPFALAVQATQGGSKDSLVVKGSLDTNSNTMKLSGSLDSEGDTTTVGSFEFSYKPSADSSFKVSKPENAKNILQLLNDLNLGQLFTGAGGTSQ